MMLEVTNMLDQFGNETDDPDKAVVIIVKNEEGKFEVWEGVTRDELVQI